MAHNFGFWRLGEEQHPRLSTLSRGNVPTYTLSVRFTADEKAIITELRTYYGLSLDNEALRFALRAAKREMQRLRVETGEKPA